MDPSNIHDEMPPLATEHELSEQSYPRPQVGDDFDVDDDPISRSRLAGLLDQSAMRLGAGLGWAPPNDGIPDKVKELHPYCAILGLSDLESCVRLENATFPEEQRCSREKFLYRLSVCSELCLGLFTSADPSSPNHSAETAQTSNPPDSNFPERKGILLAHVIATKTENKSVTDTDMSAPSNWQNLPSADGAVDANTLRRPSVGNAKPEGEAHVGHQEHGRTIAVHSLAVLPSYQNRGLGNTLMKAYVQRMAESDIADRIAILAYRSLVSFYEKLGFEDLGVSEVKHGGVEWVNMALNFDKINQDSGEE